MVVVVVVVVVVVAPDGDGAAAGVVLAAAAAAVVVVVLVVVVVVAAAVAVITVVGWCWILKSYKYPYGQVKSNPKSPCERVSDEPVPRLRKKAQRQPSSRMPVNKAIHLRLTRLGFGV